MSLKDLSQVEPDVLLQLINQYDQYIQNASKNDCYLQEDWEPLAIEDYYATEFQLVLKTIEHQTVEDQSQEQQIAANTEDKPSSSWSTFSKKEILKPKQKPWWRKLLPW